MFNRTTPHGDVNNLYGVTGAVPAKSLLERLATSDTLAAAARLTPGEAVHAAGEL
jgi:hypothetical protein